MKMNHLRLEDVVGWYILSHGIVNIEGHIHIQLLQKYKKNIQARKINNDLRQKSPVSTFYLDTPNI